MDKLKENTQNESNNESSKENKKDTWAKLKVSTRGTVIISWLMLVFVLFSELFGFKVNEYFIDQVFYFALICMAFSSLGVNSIEVVADSLKRRFVKK